MIRIEYSWSYEYCDFKITRFAQFTDSEKPEMDPKYRKLKDLVKKHLIDCHSDELLEFIESNTEAKSQKDPLSWVAGWIASYSIELK